MNLHLSVASSKAKHLRPGDARWSPGLRPSRPSHPGFPSFWFRPRGLGRRDAGNLGTLPPVSEAKTLSLPSRLEVVDRIIYDPKFCEAELGVRALFTAREEPISSTCTVFAESEIISLIARGAAPDSILRGLHRSLVGRMVSMVRSVGIVAPLMLSGGVGKNEAVREMIAEATVEDVVLPAEPQLMGAYGAALLGIS